MNTLYLFVLAGVWLPLANSDLAMVLEVFVHITNKKTYKVIVFQ